MSVSSLSVSFSNTSSTTCTLLVLLLSLTTSCPSLVLPLPSIYCLIICLLHVFLAIAEEICEQSIKSIKAGYSLDLHCLSESDKKVC